MKIDINQPVGQFAIELMGAVPIFEKYNIRYYPENFKKLSEACSEGNISAEKVLEDLSKCEGIPPGWLSQPPDFTKEKMASVIRYLIHYHHVRTRFLLDGISEILGRIVEQGHEHMRLEVVRNLFNKVNGELRNHMAEEERVIFPYLVFVERELEKRGPADGSVIRDKRFTESIREMLFEHRFMDKGFTEIQKLVYLFRSENNSAELKPLEKILKELEEDNEKHIHLENNVLLKRAAQLGLMD